MATGSGQDMDMRELKGLEIAARYKIAFEGDAWMVPSQTSPATKYRVTLKPVSCTCEDFQLRQQPCKHVHAARLVQERDHGGKAPVVVDSVPKKPTYRQNWPAYNLAQTTEKHRFQVLLEDLCRGVPQLPQPERGQRRAPTADLIFSMVFKVYSTVSTRRFTCDLEDALEKGHVSQAIHYNSICRGFETAELTPILQDLIIKSSLPLRAVETDFAPDSTGFSTSRFVKWYDEKYGVQRSGHDWVKVHIMTGVRTNIITAAEIHGRDANDSPILPSLLKTTTGSGFTVKEVPADKGYSSVENIEAIEAAGATPFIAFKSSATGSSGGLWEKAFYYYSLHREDFLKHYHKRSNVESTFSMVKAKFRDHVRAKTDTAMTNEVLCKLLCHNICVLIQSQCELGIEPVFWQDEADGEAGEAPAVLPLVRPG
jgi:transposase